MKNASCSRLGIPLPKDQCWPCCCHTHVWMVPSPCPAWSFHLGSEEPQNQAGHHNPSTASRSCLGGAVGRDPSAHTAPKHPPASAGQLMDTGRTELWKACPCFEFPSTRIQPCMGVSVCTVGPQSRLPAESWCASFNPSKPWLSQPPPGHHSPLRAVSLWQPLALPWRDHHPPSPLVKYQHLCQGTNWAAGIHPGRALPRALQTQDTQELVTGV